MRLTYGMGFDIFAPIKAEVPLRFRTVGIVVFLIKGLIIVLNIWSELVPQSYFRRNGVFI